MIHSIVKENLNCFKVLGIVKRAIEHCWEGIHGEEYQVLWAYVKEWFGLMNCSLLL